MHEKYEQEKISKMNAIVLESDRELKRSNEACEIIMDDLKHWQEKLKVIMKNCI
jgi:hypothetical protein